MKTLIQYAQTDRQREIIQAIIEHGSQRKAAKELGVHKGTISGILDKVKRHAAKDSYATLNGYRSWQDSKAIVYHREFGEVERHTVNIAMVK